MKVTSKIVLAILLTVSLAGNVLAGSKEDANMKLIGNFAKEVFADKNLSSVDQYIKADYIQHNPLVSQGKTRDTPRIYGELVGVLVK